jgi:hypothetical protein
MEWDAELEQRYYATRWTLSNVLPHMSHVFPKVLLQLLLDYVQHVHSPLHFRLLRSDSYWAHDSDHHGSLEEYSSSATLDTSGPHTKLVIQFYNNELPRSHYNPDYKQISRSFSQWYLHLQVYQFTHPIGASDPSKWVTLWYNRRISEDKMVWSKYQTKHTPPPFLSVKLECQRQSLEIDIDAEHGSYQDNLGFQMGWAEYDLHDRRWFTQISFPISLPIETRDNLFHSVFHLSKKRKPNTVS